MVIITWFTTTRNLITTPHIYQEICLQLQFRRSLFPECPRKTVAMPSIAAACSTYSFWSTFFVSLQSDQVHEAIQNVHANPASNIILPAYDFIIAGGGTAGCTLASRLSENPFWTVLLLEAGPPEIHYTDVPGMYTSDTNEFVYDFFTVPQNATCSARGCSAIRGRGLGGSSIINGMLYVRGCRQNYDDWAAMGNVGWSYEEVLPYFIRSEDAHITNEFDADYHGTGGGNKQDGTTQPKWRRGPSAKSIWNQTPTRRGRIHYADNNFRKHERTNHYDCRKGSAHDWPRLGSRTLG